MLLAREFVKLFSRLIPALLPNHRSAANTKPFNGFLRLCDPQVNLFPDRLFFFVHHSVSSLPFN